MFCDVRQARHELEVVVRAAKERMKFLHPDRCRNFEQGIHVRFHGTYAVLIECEAGEVKFCDVKRTLLIVERHVALREC